MKDQTSERIARRCGLTRANLCPTDIDDTNPLVNPANGDRTSFGTDTSAAAWRDQPIAVPFGWVRVDGAAIFINPTRHGFIGVQKQCVLVSYGKGPVQNLETEDLFIDSVRSSAYSMVTLVAKYLGTYAQDASTHLASYTSPAYFQKHPGLCCIVWDFDEAWTGGLPTFPGYVSGYNLVYDPRLSGGAGGTAWTDNLCLIAAEILTNANLSNDQITAAEVEWTSVTDCANEYDAWLANGSALNISGASVAGGKCTITCTANHGLHIGDYVYISGITGTIGTNLNSLYWRVRECPTDHAAKFIVASQDMTFPSTAGWGTWTSGGTVAPKYKQGGTSLKWQRGASLLQWMETLRSHQNMQIVRVGGKFRFYPDKAAAAPVFAFDASTPGLNVQNQTWGSVPERDKPAAVEVTFFGKYEAVYGGYPRGDDTDSVQYPDDANVEDESRIWKYQCEGLQTALQAKALATLLFKWATLGNIRGAFECSSEGLELIQWSMITIAEYMDYAGASPESIRLVTVTPLSDRTYKIAWRNYDAAVYP